MKRHQIHSDSQTIVKSGEGETLLMKHARFDSELKFVRWHNGIMLDYVSHTLRY